MKPALLAVAVTCLLTTGSLADDLYLVNGGKIQGEIRNPDLRSGEAYVIETAFGGQVTVPSDQVAKVVAKSAYEERYAELLPSVRDTEADHLKMAARCQKAGLDDRREFHLRQALRHNPENAEARRALGYSQIDGKWIRQDEWMTKQGYVRSGGRWRLPQEIELARVKDAREQAIVGWRKKLKTWRTWVVKGRDRQQLGLAEIRAVRDPAAGAALVELLENDKERNALRLVYVEVLGQLQGGEGSGALTKHALYNDNAKIRDACLDQLERIRPAIAVSTFVDGLKHKENRFVVRSALGLNRMQDASATLPLIDALITEHKHEIQIGGGIAPTFSNAGGGLSAGSKREVKKIKQKNDAVLHALTALHPGVNFGFNQNAWRNWYVTQKTPPPVHLRRDRN